jgi:predicted glycosyltransferase
VGRRLFETAIAARARSRLRDRTWRIVGAATEDLKGGDGIVVEGFRNDFTMLLRNCELSVSQAGYNTLMETLQARARAVVVPFSQGSETEQGMRARLMAERGLFDVLEEKDLAAASLAAAIDRAAARPRPARAEIDLDGARRSAELLRQWTS